MNGAVRCRAIYQQRNTTQAPGEVLAYFRFASGGNFTYCWRVLLIEMRKKLKWILGGLVAGFALLQLANPLRTNPPVVPGHDLMAANPPPPPIAALLRAACYDCHSHETKWPWYSHIAPASWLVVDDVKKGRQHMNLSEWPQASPERAAKQLERISEEVDYQEMPPGKYTLLHPEARLTADQRQALIHWADSEAARLKTASTHQ